MSTTRKAINLDYRMLGRAFYAGKLWRECRASFLSIHPFCETCAQVGKVTRAVEVDHVVPIRSGGHPLKPENLHALCNDCYSSEWPDAGTKVQHHSAVMPRMATHPWFQADEL